MDECKTREPQYRACVEAVKARGFERLGLSGTHSWYEDPRHLLFQLSRYKFVAKMLSGCQNVLEIGCGDAFGTRLVQQEVGALTATDFDPVFVADVQARMLDRWRFSAFTQDVLEGPIAGSFDGIYALDVLEHIDQAVEMTFLKNAFTPLTEHGVAIIGTPSLESQPYASPLSKAAHVNCKTMPGLKRTMQQLFHNVFMFGMNDEVVHTGHHKMAHYVFAVACSKK